MHFSYPGLRIRVTITFFYIDSTVSNAIVYACHVMEVHDQKIQDFQKKIVI